MAFHLYIIQFYVSTLQIYGDGSQTRSFQYVSDLVDGLIALMNSNYTQPVNLGNPIESTIKGFKEFSFLQFAIKKEAFWTINLLPSQKDIICHNFMHP